MIKFLWTVNVHVQCDRCKTCREFFGHGADPEAARAASARARARIGWVARRRRDLVAAGAASPRAEVDALCPACAKQGVQAPDSSRET